MASFVLQVVAPIVGSLAFEKLYLRLNFEQLYSTSTTLALPRAFSGVIAVNLIGSSLLLVKLGMDVSKARTAAKAKAKDEDPNCEERYSYPKLYAEGFSAEANQFNCVQRGHQQAFETYPQFLALSIIGGLQFPVTVSIGGLLWIFARNAWAQGYSTGSPSKRYDAFISRWIWWGLVCQLFAATGTMVTLLIEK